MGESAQSWPPRVRSREDREDPTASFDRESDREFAPTSWPPDVNDRESGTASRYREDRENDRESGARVHLVGAGVPALEHDEYAETPLPGWLSWLEEWRVIRGGVTTADNIAYAKEGAYSIRKDGPLRKLNIAFAHTIATAGTLLCDTVKFAFCQRLSRFALSVLVFFALAWALNHIPVTAWLIPDGWDFSTWWTDPPVVVEVPVEAPIGEG